MSYKEKESVYYISRIVYSFYYIYSNACERDYSLSLFVCFYLSFFIYAMIHCFERARLKSFSILLVTRRFCGIRIVVFAHDGLFLNIIRYDDCISNKGSNVIASA